jgi:hypothetical protein
MQGISVARWGVYDPNMQAGGGGDRVMQAKATLNRARTLDEQGNSAGCLETLAEAKHQPRSVTARSKWIDTLTPVAQCVELCLS